MGARDLYIAEVHDVSRTGTDKTYGRVFYAKGKSLIFYVYDLDAQPGLRNAGSFQAWGRRGPDSHPKPLSASGRWMGSATRGRSGTRKCHRYLAGTKANHGAHAHLTGVCCLAQFPYLIPCIFESEVTARDSLSCMRSL
jgi:hypothetical protein